MHQITSHSNIRYQDLIQPAAFIALAFFAGSKRYIHYFKGTSRQGLFLSAAISGATTLCYDHKIRIRREGFVETFLGKGLCMTLSTLATSMLLKNLQTRVSLPPRGALYFVALQMLPVGLIPTSHPRPLKTPPSPPSSDKTPPKKPDPVPTPVYKEQYGRYKSNLLAWQQLSTDERTDLAKTFYEHDLPVLSLFQAAINPWEEGHLDLSSQSKEQLSWHREIFQCQCDLRDFPAEKLLEYNYLFSSNGLGILHCALNQQLREAIDKDTRYANMYYQEFQRHPEFFFVQDNQESLRKIVSFQKDSSTFSLDQRLCFLTSPEIARMDLSLLDVWHHILSQKKHIWVALDPPLQKAFNTRFTHFKFDNIRSSFKTKDRKSDFKQ